MFFNSGVNLSANKNSLFEFSTSFVSASGCAAGFVAAYFCGGKGFGCIAGFNRVLVSLGIFFETINNTPLYEELIFSSSKLLKTFSWAFALK